MENRLFDSPFNPGYSRSDWSNGWNRVKQPRVYEVEYFGDFVVPAVACGLKKTILVFNTSLRTPKTPVEVITPSIYNVHPTTDIPIVLAYNEYHYESLHPESEVDVEKCIQLVNIFKEGNYHYTFNDLRALVSLENVPIINNETEAVIVENVPITNNVKKASNTETPFPSEKQMDASKEPSLGEQNKSTLRKRQLDKTGLNYTKSKKIKDMTPEEKREYFREKQRESRAAMFSVDPEGFRTILRNSKRTIEKIKNLWMQKDLE